MKRTAVLTLEATKTELSRILLETIQKEQRVTITDSHYDVERGIFRFTATEGYNPSIINPAVSTLDAGDILSLSPARTAKPPKTPINLKSTKGLNKALECCMEDGHLWPFDKLCGEVRRLGVDVDDWQVKQRLRANGYVETDPGVWQDPTAFKKSKEASVIPAE